MPGMFFELFAFLTIIIVILLVIGASFRRVWPLILAGVFMIMTGAALLSDGIRFESGGTFDTATGIVTYTFSSLTAANDATVAMLSNSFFYGGFAVIIVAAFYLLLHKPGKGPVP